MVNIELSRFRVKEGKSKVVDEWLAFLNENAPILVFGT